MADGSGSISLGSEPFYDFSCSVCAKDGKHTEGECFCVECNETFCTSCLLFHNKIAIMRQHEMLDKTETATRRPQQDLLQQPTSKCSVHSGQIINMYCGQDDLVCCTVCIAEDHRTCEGVIYIPKKAQNIKTSQEFLDVYAAIDTMKANIEILKKAKQLDLDTITAQHAMIQASIGKLRDQVNKHLDDLEASSRDELNRKFKIHTDKINDTIANLDFELLKMEKRGIKFKDAQNESQLFVDMKEAKMKDKEERKLIDNADESVGKPAMHFKPNDEIVNILEIKSFGIWDDQVSFTSVSHHGDFNVKTQDDQTTCYITDSCQMLDGNIVITDLYNEKLKLLDRSYKVIAECKLPCRPMNVCRTSPTEVAIAMTKNKTVLFAEVTDNISIKGSFSVSDHCRGIAYNKGLLYVACGGGTDDNEGPGQVRVYDMAGKLLQTFMKDEHNKDLIYYPEGIALSACRTKNYIVDSAYGIVSMNLDGSGQMKFTSPVLKSPNGICVVNNDNLLVCGFNSNNVVLFNQNVQQKVELIKKEDGIGYPLSVLYDKPNSRLIVSTHESNHIKIYNLL